MTNVPSGRAALVPARAAFAIAAAGTARAQIPIAWQLGDFAGQPGQRVALAVVAQVGGRPCTLQVDTGFDDAVAWHGAPAAGRRMVDVAVDFAGRHVVVPTPADRARQLAGCAPGQPVGSLGNAFFDRGTLAIDLKSSRLTWTSGGALAARLDAQPMFYARWTPAGGRPLVEIRKAGALRGYALLDTGSAAIAFAAAGKPQWDAATGDAPLHAAPNVAGFSASSRGRALPCFVAPGASALQAGTWTLTSPQVTYCPTSDFAPPLRLEGVLGLRGFGDSVVSIDYVSGRWLVEKAR